MSVVVSSNCSNVETFSSLSNNKLGWGTVCAGHDALVVPLDSSADLNKASSASKLWLN